MPGPLGAFIDERVTDAVCMVFAQRGQEPLFCDARSAFRGAGAEASVFLFDAEAKLYAGNHLPADFQQRGTCVGRGTYRACQDSLYWAIAFGSAVGKTVKLSYETIYGGARIQIGNGALGNGDGAYGAYAAQYVHDYGLLARGKYGSIDLSQSREDLAVTWGAPHHGVPASIVAESASYKVQACFRCQSTDDIADSIASGYGVAFCSNTLWGEQRDADGMCRPAGRGGHCECVRAVFRDRKGRRIFVRGQSWGDNPRGGGKFKLDDGREVQPPQGCYGAYESDMQEALSEGEAWAFGTVNSPWRDSMLPSEV